MEKNKEILNAFLKKNKEKHLEFLKLYINQDDEHEKLVHKIKIAKNELRKYEIPNTPSASIIQNLSDGLFKPEVKEYIENLSLLTSRRRSLHSLEITLKKTPPADTLTQIIANYSKQIEKLEEELADLKKSESETTPKIVGNIHHASHSLDDQTPMGKTKDTTSQIRNLKEKIQEAEYIKEIPEKKTEFQSDIAKLKQRNMKIKQIVLEELQNALDEGNEAKKNGEIEDGYVFFEMPKRAHMAMEITNYLSQYKELEKKYYQEEGHWYLKGENKKVIDINDEDYERLCKTHTPHSMSDTRKSYCEIIKGDGESSYGITDESNGYHIVARYDNLLSALNNMAGWTLADSYHDALGRHWLLSKEISAL